MILSTVLSAEYPGHVTKHVQHVDRLSMGTVSGFDTSQDPHASETVCAWRIGNGIGGGW
jgi:hypothetical protein